MKKNKKSSGFKKLRAVLPASSIRTPTPKQIDLRGLGESPFHKVAQGLRKTAGKAWQTFRGFVAGVSVFAGVLFFWPRLDIAPGPTHENAVDLTKVPLSLTNSGFLAIYPETVTCWVLDYAVHSTPVPPMHMGGLHNIGFRYTVATATITDGTNGELTRGETADFIPVPPIRFSGLVADSAEFLIIVDYYQHWWPFALQKRVKYSVSKNAEGRWEWLRPYLSAADRTLNPPSTIIFDAKARKRALDEEAKKNNNP